MATNARTIKATTDAVWAVLADGWLYPLWVVGASRMRDVDETWPQPGARLQHSVGSWPLLLDDVTEVVELTPGRALSLEAKTRPGGVARVDIVLESVGTDTRVTMSEDIVAGPARLVPKLLRDPGMTWRNTEALRRLALVVEGRHAGA